jgi:hypothetical protein
MHAVSVVLFINRIARSEAQSLDPGNSQHSLVAVPGTFVLFPVSFVRFRIHEPA